MNWNPKMAAMSWQTTSKPASVCVLPGFAEGRHTMREFPARLESHGFTLTDDLRAAKIIIAHSGGCFVIPEHVNAKLILLVGIPYWPGKSTLRSTIDKTRLAYREHRNNHNIRRWLARQMWHVFYIGYIRQNIAIVQGRRAATIWKKRPAAQTVVVRNEQDAYCMPDLYSLPFQSKPIFVTLPGGHDDCWQNPEPYIDLIKSYYG